MESWGRKTIQTEGQANAQRPAMHTNRRDRTRQRLGDRNSEKVGPVGMDGSTGRRAPSLGIIAGGNADLPNTGQECGCDSQTSLCIKIT